MPLRGDPDLRDFHKSFMVNLSEELQSAAAKAVTLKLSKELFLDLAESSYDFMRSWHEKETWDK